MQRPCLSLARIKFHTYRKHTRLIHSTPTVSANNIPPRAARNDKRWPGWEVVIGIEVHAQLKTRRKLFSQSLTSNPGEVPNTHVSPYDASFPGTLPTLNPKCIDLALRIALALNADIQLRSAFDRKHYFYADLPAGYQITQYYAPIALGGRLQLSKMNSGHVVRIKQIQLEQDTAKSTSDPRHHISHIDLNRAGTGLMEIVSEPDMRSPEQAADYVRTLQAVLRSVGSSDGNMEQGSMRCDVNVSVNRPGDAPGTRCEIKNLNSVKGMMVAISSEIYRQTGLLTSTPPAPIVQETRGFDEQKAETFKLRSKEDAPDYRYMPDPNLPPLLLTEEYISRIRTTMPELPHETRVRLQMQYGLTERDADVLMSVDAGRGVLYDGEVGGGAVRYFETLCRAGGAGREAKAVVNWLTHELLGQLAARKETFNDDCLGVEQMGELIDLVQNGLITGTSGKTILRHMLDNRSSAMPSQIARDLQLVAFASTSSSPSSVSSTLPPSSELEVLCTDAIASMPNEAAAARKGNKNVINKFVGNVMQRSRGRADARSVRDVLERLLLG